MTKTITVLSGLIRPLVEERLPEWIEPRFFQSKEEAMTLAPEAEIGWFDMYDKADMAAAITAATVSGGIRLGVPPPKKIDETLRPCSKAASCRRSASSAARHAA